MNFIDLSNKTDLRIPELEPTKKKKELSANRDKKPTSIDACIKDLESMTTFGERIAYFTQAHLAPRQIYFLNGDMEPLDFVNRFAFTEKTIPVGIASHRLCEMNSYRFFRTVSKDGRYVLTPEEKELANAFIARFKLTQAEAKKGEETKDSKQSNEPKNTGDQSPSEKQEKADPIQALIDLIDANRKLIALPVFQVIHQKSAASAKTPEAAAAARTYDKLKSKIASKKSKDEDRKKAIADLRDYVTRKSLAEISADFSLVNNNIPDDQTIEKVNRFAKEHNTYREQIRSKEEINRTLGRRRMTALWANLMHCISYAESLMEPDTQRAHDLAEIYFPQDESGNPGKTKEDGIEWYMDLSQDGKSKQLAVGLFQFTPDSVANQLPCVHAWNKTYESCPIDPWKSLEDGSRKWDKKKMLGLISSPLQTYNANCGVNKLVQSFYIQANTTDVRRTHTANLKVAGDFNSGLKPAQDRCVTPHFHSTLTFNHFGPLQNSTGNNLALIMKCVY